VIVACCDDGFFSKTGKLVELNSRGETVREIILQSRITSLSSVRALEGGGYVVSYRGLWCREWEVISSFDDSGNVTKSYGDWWFPLEGRELLGGKCHMAIDSDGFVFVTDWRKSRIVLLNPSLEYVRSISTKFLPKCLHLDKQSRRLFVGHPCYYLFQKDVNKVTVISL